MSKYISFPLDETWYTAEAEQLYNSNRTNGVFSANDEFLTTFKAGMTVTVSTGRAWLHIAKFKGFVFGSFENVDLTLDIGDGILNRIDRIVIRYDVVNNTTTLQILKGTPAQTPVPPPIVREELTYYDLCIAEVTINAGVITLNQGMISDKRLDETLCGVVKDGIESIPTQALQSQWEGWFNALTTKGTTDWNNWYNTNTSNFANQFNTWYNTNTALFGNRFNTWFATVQNTLSGDVAGNLLTLINNLRADVPNIKVNNAVNADKLNNKTDEDFTKRVNLTNKIQLSGNTSSVIGLCELTNSDPSLNSFSNGFLTFKRINGLYEIVNAFIGFEKKYNTTQTNAFIFSNYSSNTDKLIPVTFTYNGKKYAGLKVALNPANFEIVEFNGATNFGIFGVDYFKYNTSTILNAEIYNSISENDINLVTSIQWNKRDLAFKDETINKNGDTMTGILTAQSNTSYTTRQVRNIILSSSDADVNQMQNGDIWIKYK